MTGASLHNEPYRPWKGTLRDPRPRFRPLLTASVRNAFKRKLPLLLLYGPVGIATVVSSFLVYARFVVREQLPQNADLPTLLAAGLAEQLFDVKGIISNFNDSLSNFALLAAAWFGSGLMPDDRRTGAHALLFSRPLSRLDYVLGRLAHASGFAALAVLVPGILVCLVATFTSPRWSFVTEEPETIGWTVAFATVWSLAVGLIVLAVSSLARRKSHALIAFFGGLFAVSSGSFALHETTGDSRWAWLSPVRDLDVLRIWVFDARSLGEGPHVALQVDDALARGALWSLLAWTFAALVVLVVRVRTLEAVR